ncbi:hypothetical protein PISMIDRAFT_671873 [Pisolithus microcarpus 441]|uniref:Unplaced genomic scaffold scaffold_4, whole genome shotgun sequence n=1 Tax=Pisolithus microcarpus 441 TaxID=765257 RepID=A0A0C9YXP9_9AGAM|nr:hypothetical protein PISMIDRAFT_671873 [Pisolithus microcarpus 441]
MEALNHGHQGNVYWSFPVTVVIGQAFMRESSHSTGVPPDNNRVVASLGPSSESIKQFLANRLVPLGLFAPAQAETCMFMNI